MALHSAIIDAGLLRDKTRPPAIAPLAPSLVDRVMALTLEPPGHETTHWTVRTMAKAIGIATSSVVICLGGPAR